MIYIGIDPGKAGAMGVIYGQAAYAIPFDEEAYRDELRNLADQGCVCVLEKVGARPGQGVTSMFNFGENFGFIRGLLTAYNIPYQLVSPQVWKKEFSLNSEKAASVTVCKRLFPLQSLLPTDRCKKESDGMAEALLMAEYGRRKNL